MLELSQSESCPHCAEMRDKLNVNELGGQDQLPSLVDTGREETLYESDDIVDYLEAHYG